MKRPSRRNPEAHLLSRSIAHDRRSQWEVGRRLGVALGGQKSGNLERRRAGCIAARGDPLRIGPHADLAASVRQRENETVGRRARAGRWLRVRAAPVPPNHLHGHVLAGSYSPQDRKRGIGGVWISRETPHPRNDPWLVTGRRTYEANPGPPKQRAGTFADVFERDSPDKASRRALEGERCAEVSRTARRGEFTERDGRLARAVRDPRDRLPARVAAEAASEQQRHERERSRALHTVIIVAAWPTA
jgi:hypothetical protein